MPVFVFPVEPSTAKQFGPIIVFRLSDYLMRRGYVLGQGSIQVPHDGRILVDVDRDPSADVAAFDFTQPTPDEIDRRTRRQQFVAGMTALRADYAKLDDETQAVSQLEFRRMLKRVNRGVTFLGEILQDLNQIERNGQ